MIAGHTSIIALNPAYTQMSQNGTSKQNGARMTAITLERTSMSMPLQRVVQRLEFRERQRQQARCRNQGKTRGLKRLKPRLMRMAPQTATGVPKRPCLKQGAQSKRDQQELQTAIIRNVGQALLQRLESPRLTVSCRER